MKKVLLVEVYDEKIFYENNGIHRIAAYLEKNDRRYDRVYEGWNYYF